VARDSIDSDWANANGHLGQMVGSVGVCFAILLIDEASGFAEVYGINNKNDLVDALAIAKA
jgi:hypothetical protein